MDISETAQLGPFDQLNITNFIIRVPLLSIKLKTIFTHVTQQLFYLECLESQVW